MKTIATVLVFLLLFINATPAYGSLITIEKEGNVVFSVLAEEDSIALGTSGQSNIEVNKIADEKVGEDSSVSLSREGGKINLGVSDGNETRQMNVSEISDDLVELEERPEIQKINIGIRDDKFSLEQKGVVALTSFPIKIDAKRAVLSVTTSKGDEFLSIMHY